MIPWHVVSGMNGAVMVLPRDGLNDGHGHALHYDKVYYIGEQDLYVPRDEKGNFKSYDSPGEAYADTEEVMRKLIPTHVVFNGKVGALTGKNALTATSRLRHRLHPRCPRRRLRHRRAARQSRLPPGARAESMDEPPRLPLRRDLTAQDLTANVWKNAELLGRRW